jgi:hypothetical protein
VTIPTPAVQRGPNGTFAYVVQGDRVSLRNIAVGQQNETTAVIVKGISASERVVTTGFPRLKDGARIALPDEKQPPAGASPQKQPPPAAAASEGREKIRTACAADVQKFCPSIERNREAIRGCLQAHASELSEACKAASAGQKGGHKAREADVRQAEGNSTQ